MSGGYFEYSNFHLNTIAEEIKELIENNNNTELDSWGSPIGRQYSRKVINKFKKAVRVLRIASIYAHRIDYLVSGDDGEKSFLERLEEELVGYENVDKNPIFPDKNEPCICGSTKRYYDEGLHLAVCPNCYRMYRLYMDF
jgi:Rad3-related DNA helicase